MTVKKTRGPTAEQVTLRRVGALARFLDDSIPIPGTNIRIGFDAIIGLIPGFGDLAGGILSTYIVVQAIELGIPKPTVVRMAFNILVETVLGAIPVLGDIFDAAWKSNVKNARLLEGALIVERKRGLKDTAFLAILVVALLALSVAGCALSWWIFMTLKEAMTAPT